MQLIITPKNKPLILYSTLVGALILLVIWNYLGLAQSQAAAVGAAKDLADCRRLASRIQALSRQPARAGTQEVQLKELISRIETAAKNAQISPDSLIRIWPEPAQRIGDTPYQQKPTQILLRQVTLKHIIKFLHTLTSGDLGLYADAIRLTSPRSEETGKTWTAEVTLTYHIYAPRK